MTRGTFSAAIDRIDLTYVSEALNRSESEKTKKTTTKRSTIFKIASVAACFAIVLVSVLAITTKKGESNSPIGKFGQEMIVAPAVSGKPTTGHKIGIKCYSFYSESIINLDVYMSQTLFESEKEKINGYPVFEINQGTGDNADVGTVRINGNDKKYEKDFAIDDLSYLVADSAVSDVFDGHCENITLDFSNVKNGGTAALTFSYGFFYYTDNPYNESKRENSWCGMRRTLYFYRGENGVSVSSIDAGDAFSNYKENNKTDMEYGNEPDTDINCSAKPIYLIPLTGSISKVQHGNCFVNQFKIISTKGFEEYSIRIDSSDGVNIVGDDEYQTSNDILEIKYYLANCSPYGTIDIDVCGINDSEQRTFSKTIYCVSGFDADYSCTSCLDCLKDYSVDIEQLLISTEKSDEISCVSHNANRSVKYFPTYDVQGYIRWTDSSGTVHPARNVTVEIRGTSSSTSSSWLLATLTTNDSGYYSVTFPATGSGENVFIRVKSKGLNITVKDPSGEEYQYESGIYYGLSDGDAATISYTADNMYCLGKSLGVHQAMELANRYMYSLENTYMDNVIVSFPDDSEGTTCFKKSENKIYVLNGDAFDWDVLEHEYGHFVAYKFDILANVGGTHTLGEILAVTKGKNTGIQLAWNEGWATYFSINLQDKTSASSMNIPNVGDKNYTDTEDASINYSVESVASAYLLGESGEVAVSGILFDITDPSSSSDYDEIYCSNSNIWDITKSNNCKTLSSFVTAFYNSTFTTQTKLKLGKTLSHFKVAAQLNSSVSGLSGTTPTFTWTKQGSNATSYQNNSFKLAFYDSSYGLISRINCGNVTSKTLTSAQWNTIKATGSTVYCCVEAYQTSTPSTGPYYSNLIIISLTTSET